MPGTQYDNDYSLVGELGIQQRQIAQRLLAEYSVGELLALKHTLGEEEQNLGHLSEIDRHKIISAALVARLTYFRATPYLSPQQRKFCAQTLIDHYRLFYELHFIEPFTLDRLASHHFRSHKWLTHMLKKP